MSARTKEQEIHHRMSGHRTAGKRTVQRAASKARAIKFSKMSPRLQRSIMKYGER